MKGKVFTADDVKKIAHLAQIPLKDEEKVTFAQGFTKTIAVVDELFSVDVSGVVPTSQVTRLENVYWEDEADTSRLLKRDQVFGNAPRTQDSFFVVNQILDK